MVCLLALSSYCQTSNISHTLGNKIVDHSDQRHRLTLHLSRDMSSMSLLRCSWNITCQHCSNYIIFILHLTPGFNGLQGSTLRRGHIPGAYRSCYRAHKFLWLRARLGNWFSVWACTYFPSSIHKLYRACTNSGWACENFCRACKFSEPHAQWACKPNA